MNTRRKRETGKKKKKKKRDSARPSGGEDTEEVEVGVGNDYRRENKKNLDGHARAMVVLVVAAALLTLVIYGREIQAKIS